MSNPIMYGPQTFEVWRLLNRLSLLTVEDVTEINEYEMKPEALDAARATAVDTASRDARRTLALGLVQQDVQVQVATAKLQAMYAARVGDDVSGMDWDGAEARANDAAMGLVMRDLIDRDTYRVLVGPVADALWIRLHPDDETKEA